MFADTDFVLALIKDTDWLKINAMKILEEHKGNIRTSISVIMELAHICKRLRMDTSDTFVNVFEIIEVNEETYSICMQAAVYIEKYDLSVFDAFHAAYCGTDKIISSDSAYDKVGIKRLKLNEQEGL